ncbi:related to centromere binding factor 1 [Ustilago bromivora]|uniref:Related to centromere binding factor 1 n=1 Tax=Ustilago bromivora TaxID=307758 RepID=A0A1K0FWL5_9BASI|nr:related to centromere binding factor 1 [Ustilago bromivora]SYW75287.1 related to centromere binding factor 1 [Ustilago bromivora]
MSAATESAAPAHQREGEHIQPTANGHNFTANTTATTTEQAAEDGPQDNTNSAARNDAVAAAAALESTPDPAERDVSNILAGLNQEQLASIVAAARASEARNGAGSTENPSENTLNGETNLGQAASALTSIASGFKRTPGKDAPTAGATSSQTSTEFNGDTKDLDPATTAAITAAKTATGTATAAAIASLGSLAAASHTQQFQSTTSPHQQEPDESLDYSNPNSPGGSRKRPRGPELDRQRKDNHKEVERRRRSAINEGITQLSHIVPGCDAKNTNKGAIIHAAVRYIQDLKHNEANNIEKWTLEKLLMDQAMGDLTQQLEEARAQVERLRAELDERFASEHQQDANGKGQAGES